MSATKQSPTLMNLTETKNYCRNFERADAAIITVASNTMMAAWTMPVSWEPLVFAVSIGKIRHSHTYLNIGTTLWIGCPREDKYEEAVKIFGQQSGRDFIKPWPTPYVINGDLRRFKIIHLLDVGDHTLVIATYAEI